MTHVAGPRVFVRTVVSVLIRPSSAAGVPGRTSHSRTSAATLIRPMPNSAGSGAGSVHPPLAHGLLERPVLDGVPELAAVAGEDQLVGVPARGRGRPPGRHPVPLPQGREEGEDAD